MTTRKLSDEFKLSVRTTGEVMEALGVIVARVTTEPAARLGRRKPGKASVVSAVLLWLEEQPSAEIKRIVSEGTARLRSILGPDASIDDEPEADEGAAHPRDLDPRSEMKAHPSRPAPRRKGAG